MKVLFYNEFVHERMPGRPQEMYPNGIHMAITEGLQKIDDTLTFEYACLDDHKEVITAEKLAETDVMIWWGHMRHGQVEDSVVQLVYEAVNKGMGLIVLHSGHESKIFQRLCGTRCSVQ